jgi:serine/threonine-protein kinase
MGEVYEVRHLRTKAQLALKVLMADSRMPQHVFLRFRREAEITSNLNHPNIVKVFDFDNLPDGRPFLVMELLQGRELTRLMEPGKQLPLPQVVTIVQQIAQGLAAAHEREIVHRDLKPGNVFMMAMPSGERELVKLLDFGISKVRGGVSNLTRTDTVMGTPNYMSPEQASGRTDEADGRADQFALAAIAYELVSGHMAFPGDSPPSVLYRVVHEQPPKLRSWVAGLPSALEKVVMRGLAKRPADRFPTIVAFADAFGEAARAAKKAWRAPVVSRGNPLPAARAVGPAVVGRLTPTTTLRQSTGQMEAATAGSPGPRAGWRRASVAVAGGIAMAVIATAAIRSRSDVRPNLVAPAAIPTAAIGVPPPPGARPASPERPPVVEQVVPVARADTPPLAKPTPLARPKLVSPTAVSSAAAIVPNRPRMVAAAPPRAIHQVMTPASAQAQAPAQAPAQPPKPPAVRRVKKLENKPRNEEL